MRRLRVPIEPPRSVDENLSLGEGVTTHQDQRLKCALVVLRGVQVNLGLNDTARCAADLDAARRTLGNLAERHKLSRTLFERYAGDLQAHCQRFAGRKEELPDYGQ